MNRFLLILLIASASVVFSYLSGIRLNTLVALGAACIMIIAGALLLHQRAKRYVEPTITVDSE